MTDGSSQADRINEALQALDESLDDDLGAAEAAIKKEQIRRDVFTTEEEAQERAEEIGCTGTHSHDEEGKEVFMPCATHEEYIERTGVDVAEEGESKEEYIDFRSEI